MDMEKLIERAIEVLLAWAPSVLGAVLILVLGWLGARILRAVLSRSLVRARVDETLVQFLASVVYVAVMLLVIVAAVGRLGVNTTSFAAVLAAAGLAIGLAFQDSLSNFAAGVLLILFRPFRVGDYVEAGGVSGSVAEIQIFTTVFNTPDNKRVIVGNSAITGSQITNFSANDTRRVDMVIGIGYGDDIARAKQIVEGILADDARVLKSPAPTVAVSELGDSSVNLVVRPWVATADYWSVCFDLHERIKVTFDQQGISIPFPQRDLHVYQAA